MPNDQETCSICGEAITEEEDDRYNGLCSSCFVKEQDKKLDPSEGAYATVAEWNRKWALHLSQQN